MIRIICPDCKNAYLQKAEADLTCPGCNTTFPESEENFLSGAQYYHEGDFAAAGDCLMKYIVKNGAEPRAIFYKALCDAQNFDEDTSSLKDLYVKLLESLMEISDDDFVRYLVMANDEVLKVEKAVTQLHLELFAEADAEKIKKEVSAIIKLQDEAKIYRNKLNEFAGAYNERAVNKISVKLSPCFFVDPVAATEVGAKKFEKIVESINSHTVFTGILSNEIKNLEIYYRCIVMFFEKNRQKYEFLMSSSEKFAQIAKLLEDGRYQSIKGVPTICEKLKAAGYDFFQESLRDHDDEFEQQTETVVVLAAETVEVPVEETTEEPSQEQETPTDATEFEDVYSSTTEPEATTEPEEIQETENTEDVVSEEDSVVDVTEVIEEIAEVEETSVTTEPEESTEVEEVAEIEETTEAEEIVEPEEVAEVEEKVEVAEDIEAEENSVIEIPETVEEAEETTQALTEDEPTTAEDVTDTATETPEEATETEALEEVTEPETQTTLLKTIAENGSVAEDKTTDVTEDTTVAPEKNAADETDAPKKRKHKKSVAPIIAVVVVLVAIIGLVALKVVPAKLNESNYEKAGILFTEKNYGEAAEIYENLGDYEDSADKYLLARYNQALALEEAKKFDEAKQIYIDLGNYEDSAGRVNSCIYNSALSLMEQGNYDEAITIFISLEGYADSNSMIDECNYRKAVKLIEAKDYQKAIETLIALPDHPDSENTILEAKYAYVNENLSAENETTLSYLKDLAQAKYKDSGDLRNKLLGTSAVLGEGIAVCINYSETDTTENLTEVDSSKTFYFHVTVTNEALYTKKLTLDYETSAGYGFPEKSFVLTENENTYTLKYPSDPGANYSITFSVISDDSTTLISQTVALK